MLRQTIILITYTTYIVGFSDDGWEEVDPSNCEGIFCAMQIPRCPNFEGKEQVRCASKTANEEIERCIHVDLLCDEKPDCPQGEDEINSFCMFHILGREQIDLVRRSMLMHLQEAVDGSPISKTERYRKKLAEERFLNRHK